MEENGRKTGENESKPVWLWWGGWQVGRINPISWLTGRPNMNPVLWHYVWSQTGTG